MYSRIFSREFNISFFIPKNDQYSHCEPYKNAEEVQKVMLDEDYQLH